MMFRNFYKSFYKTSNSKVALAHFYNLNMYNHTTIMIMWDACIIYGEIRICF